MPPLPGWSDLSEGLLRALRLSGSPVVLVAIVSRRRRGVVMVLKRNHSA